MTVDPQAQALWAQDQASPGLGMSLDHAAPGTARLSMRVRPDMLNGHRNCHGGLIFTLADSAFAFACNTGPHLPPGLVNVAAHASITFLRPARENDVLVATAEQRTSEGRSGIYDVRVTAGPHVIAEFRGLCRTTPQPPGPHAP